MRTLLLLFLFLINIHLRSQVIIDTLLESGTSPNINLAPSYDYGHDLIYTINTNTNGSFPYILVYDNKLSVLDTLYGTDIGRPTAHFLTSYEFNASNYYLCGDGVTPTSREFSIHRIENGQFTDSIDLNLDTIPNAYPYTAREIDRNTLEVTINYATLGSPSRTGGLLFLDSNFNKKSYHEFDFSALPSTQNKVNFVEAISDSSWHVYFSDKIATYNPKTKTFTSNDTVTTLIRNSYRIDSQTYLALGMVSSPVAPVQTGWSQTPSIGFYYMNNQGSIIDTVAFNAYKDTVLFLGINNYSNEASGTYFTNSIVYDSNNIFLASLGDYSAWGESNFIQYFYVVKTNTQGKLIWDFKFLAEGNRLADLTGVAPTPDHGIVLTGSIDRPSGEYAITIKLGPDGTITNLELDAPETVINFYPNPVKDKLYYNYLPEANGNYTLEIIDIQGKPVQDVVLENEKGYIPVSLQSGFYLYHLKSKNGKVEQVGRLVVE